MSLAPVAHEGDSAAVQSGLLHQVLSEELLREVFGLRARVVPDPVSDGVLVVPIGARQARR